tara:strand:- start:9861 stop:10889 length:1029 start_codon:yes stop_codon:yes gene_type:complete
MKKIKTGLIAFLVYILLLYILVLSEKNVEGASISNMFDAIWYSLVTLSTVGYGDFYPVSFLGKIIGLIFVFSSLGVLGYLISQLTVKLTQYMEDKKNGLFGTKMENHIVLIGYNKFSDNILKQIVATGIRVAVVTNDKNDVDTIAETYDNSAVFTLYTDYNNFDVLNKVNISKSAKVFINLDSDTEMLVYILDLKNQFKDLEIIVSLNNTNFQNTFRSAGVLYAVSREEIAAKLVASYIFEPDVASFTEDLMASAEKSDDFDMIELRVNKENPYLNKDYDFTFSNMRKDFSSVLLGVYQNGKLYKNPIHPMTILENDYLVIISDGDHADKLKEAFGVEEGRF